MNLYIRKYEHRIIVQPLVVWLWYGKKDSSRTKKDSGEEGFGRTFVSAGSVFILPTLWRVEDVPRLRGKSWVCLGMQRRRILLQIEIEDKHSVLNHLNCLDPYK